MWESATRFLEEEVRGTFSSRLDCSFRATHVLRSCTRARGWKARTRFVGLALRRRFSGISLRHTVQALRSRTRVDPLKGDRGPIQVSPPGGELYDRRAIR